MMLHTVTNYSPRRIVDRMGIKNRLSLVLSQSIQAFLRGAPAFAMRATVRPLLIRPTARFMGS